MRRIYVPENFARFRKMTPRRKQILRYCHEYAQTHGWAASHTEIMQSCGITSKGILQSNMIALADMGYIDWKGTRQIKVLWLP